jgi:formylglycine-generating enzyme required for sulfatase activity
MNATQIETTASLWAEDSKRPAGLRQTLKIGGAEYGFCWIPAGEFEMGSPETEEYRYDDEVLHHVKLTRGFWMLETPTTQALYKEVIGKRPRRFEGDDLPVETVSWKDATKFCAALTKRLPKGVKASLPTEAQWEYACRAGTKTTYWHGNFADPEKMNYGCNVGQTTPVKKYPANPWGLFDMHGNVWEWTSDYFGNYPTGSVIDPKGPNSVSDRVIRGGFWWFARAFALFLGVSDREIHDGRLWFARVLMRLYGVSDRVIRGGCWRYYARGGRSAQRDGDSADVRSYLAGFRFLLSCD